MLLKETGADLPVDVRSRVEALLSLVSDISKRMVQFPVLFDLIQDFHEMAKAYILLFEAKLKVADTMNPRDKWLKQHEMLDKLTKEWHLIYSLAAATELGSSFLGKFQPYVDQAASDIGLTDTRGDFLLIPNFGESFSLVTVGYSSSNIAILNLPISVIHSPWELSVIWHELAGLKVIKIREQIKNFLETYARENHLELPNSRKTSGNDLIAELFRRITEGRRLDKTFKLEVKKYLSSGNGAVQKQEEIWSQDWFEQLYEDACSVFAFGEEFVSVLKTILGRQARKLTADRKHPDLGTRIQVAKRLLALQKGSAPAPVTATDRLTDNLLWAFLNQKRTDLVSALPVAFLDPAGLPEVRRELVNQMQIFNETFGDLEGGTIHVTPFEFGSMYLLEQKASDRPTRIQEKLLT
ncbi:MAG TPA: hypothetical protein VFQ23_10380, partial [Anaerolineales bacterium]|nr:hypothetical protein [Anaerolineales bacterium]